MTGLEVTDDTFQIVDDDWWGNPVADRVRLAIMDWCEHHHLDPLKIPMTAKLVRDVDRRQVETEVFLEDEQGGRIVADPEAEHPELARARHVVQLESAPLPWPAAVWEAAR